MSRNKENSLTARDAKILRDLSRQLGVEMTRADDIDFFWGRLKKAEDVLEDRILEPEEQAFYDEMVRNGLHFFNPAVWADDGGASEQEFLLLQEKRFKKRIR